MTRINAILDHRTWARPPDRCLCRNSSNPSFLINRNANHGPPNWTQFSTRTADADQRLRVGARGDPSRLHVGLGMGRGIIGERQMLLMVVVEFFGSDSLLHSQATFFIESAEVGDHTLSGAAFGAIRFDERPIRVSLSIFKSIARANEHVRLSYESHLVCQAQGLHYNTLASCWAPNPLPPHHHQTTYDKANLKKIAPLAT